VEATPLDDEVKGTAFGQFGPVLLDPAAKQQLE
jgi:hypothetical protein